MEFKNRVSQHPNRRRLIPVSGEENVYDITRDDELEGVEEGTEGQLQTGTLLTADALTQWTDGIEQDVAGAISAANSAKAISNEANQTAASANIVASQAAATASNAISMAEAAHAAAEQAVETGGIPSLDGNVLGVTTLVKTEYNALPIKNKKTLYFTWGPPTLEEASWEFIEQVSAEGTASDLWAVGDKKNIELSTGEIVTVEILGFEHDDLTAGGKAGITFGMKNLLAVPNRLNTTYTNVGGWGTCEMKTTTLPTILGQLPVDLQSVIKTVDKKATEGNNSTNIVLSSDKLFLFSEVEINATTRAGYLDEGTQYEYWRTVKNGDGSSDGIAFGVIYCGANSLLQVTVFKPIFGWTYTFQWQKFESGIWKNIPGGTINNYTIGSAENVALYRCKVTGKDVGNNPTDYIVDVTTGASPDCIKYLSNGLGAISTWWLRSPDISNGYNFRSIGLIGSIGMANADNQLGICFGFCV